MRELLYKVYICHTLALRGFQCYLGRKSNINYLTRKMKGYIYIDKGYHKGVSEQIHRAIKENGGTIISLDEEGVVDYADNSTLLGRYSPAMFDSVDFTFFWGRKQYETVQKQIPKQAKFLITGHPRFDLLKPANHYLYEDAVNNLKDQHGDFILINTNMGSGNNLRGDDFVINNYGERVKTIRDIIAFDKLKRQVYVELIKEIINETGKSVILRPHPEEDVNWYQRAFNGLNKVKVVFEGSVLPWLLASEVMIHPDCTTAIESVLLGKKPISFLPLNSPDGLITKLPLKVSEAFNDSRKLIKYLKNREFDIKQPDLDKYPFLEDYFAYSKNSIQLIVDQIDHFRTNLKKVRTNSLTVKDHLYLQYLAFRRGLIKNKSADLTRKKLKGFNEDEVYKIRNILMDNEIALKDIRTKRVTDSLYLFTK